MKTNIQFNASDDLLDIRYDNVFKAVFARDTPASKGALSDLISALIQRKITVSSITANEPPIDDIRDRSIRFDIACKSETGQLINVEMSLNPKAYEPVRLEFHAAKLFTGQDIRGAGKKYADLKEAYQIAILAKGCFFRDEALVHTFQYFDPVNNVSLAGRSRIITLELAKSERVMEKPVSEICPQEAWAAFFRYLTDREKRGKINEILQVEEGIAMASEVLIHISQDEIERARLISEEKYILDTQSELAYAREEGLEEGRMEGKLESRIEIAQKALANGATIEFIHNITGLDMETIKSL